MKKSKKEKKKKEKTRLEDVWRNFRKPHERCEKYGNFRIRGKEMKV